MKRATAMVTAVVIVTAVLAGMAGAQNAKLWTGELGETGEVPQWLVLAYIPLEANRDSANKVMDTDLLQAVGGEGKVQPSGGQKVGDAPFLIQGVDVFKPPMAGKETP